MEIKRYTRESKLTGYIPVPRGLFPLSLNPAAVLLYGILLDRATLSRKNNYCDESGWVYVVYSQEELAGVLSVSTRMIKRYVQSLEKAGLLYKRRSSRRLANQYYILLPADSLMGTGKGQCCPRDGTLPSASKGHLLPPNNLMKQQDISNSYQHSEEESL